MIIDERPLPKDAPEPYEPLKIILNHGIRKEFKTTTDVVTKVEPLNSKESDLLQVICVAMPIRTKSNLPDTSPPNSDCGT